MSCNEWQKIKLKELTTDGKGHYGIGASAVAYDENLLTYLRITDITDDGRLNKEGLMSVDDDNAEKYLLKKNDIVFARTGNSTGRSYFYEEKHGLLVFAGFLIKFNLDENKVNPRYIKYYTLTNEYKNWVNSFATGSTRKNINANMYGDLELSIPPRNVQDTIVDIIDSLENKIELNNEMNKTLEEMAQSIFKRWFVDFEFPNEEGKPYKSSGGEMVDSELCMIPKGWEVKTLDYVGDIVSGGTPSTKNEEYYGGDISWITPKDLSGYNRKFISKGERCITELGLQKSSAKLLPKGTVLFSSRAPIGYVAIAEKEVSTNQGFKSVVCNEEIMNNNYVYYFLKYNKENIENVSSGSTFKEISGSHMKNIKIIVPSKVILDKFNDLIKSFDSLLKKNYEDIDTLEEIRDSLLPKLMSGEIQI